MTTQKALARISLRALLAIVRDVLYPREVSDAILEMTTGILGIAMIAVLVSKNSQTKPLIKAAANTLENDALLPC